MTRLFLLLLLLITVACSAQAPAPESTAPGDSETSSFKEGPDGANFWRVPMRAADGAQRGDIYWARERTDVPAGARGWNIVYVSEGAEGHLEYVSGEIYVPTGAPANAGPRPLVVWNHGTSGSQDSCAPSRDNLLPAGGTARVPALDTLIARGYIVAMSDYQGLGVPGPVEYLNGPTQGMAALDVARAAAKFGPASAGNRVAMYGFSQGGQTSIWAASLQPTYAPDLDLLGVVAIAPAARHLDLSFYDLGIPVNSGYFIMRMAGLAAGHPEVRLTDMLTPAGLAELDAMSWGCYEIFGHAAQLKEPYAKREALEPGTAWRKRLEENDAFLPLPASVPVLILQGDQDVDVPIAQIRELTQDLCAQRAQVEFREFAGVDHMQLQPRGGALVPDWVDARFRAEPATVTCPGVS
jgi:pimeloyl-ACP methyl ester carboxylesterase